MLVQYLFINITRNLNKTKHLMPLKKEVLIKSNNSANQK